MSSQGDTPKNEEPNYGFYECTENLRGYCRGGYHPTLLGDMFNGRYKVLHKLGYGSYSVVWLARDLEKNKNVALKIVVADESQNCSEAKVLRALSQGNKDHRGYQFVCRLLDEFWVDGPNGHHLCLVFPPYGISLADSSDEGYKFPVNVARSLSAQALLGIEYIHSCGVVHGDLHKANILLLRPELEHFTEAEVVEHLGEPRRQPVLRYDGKPLGPGAPEYCVPCGVIGICAEDVPANATIVVSDFGQSFFATEDRDELQTPTSLLPPEHFFKGHLGPPVDVWTAAMTFWNILSGAELVEGWNPDWVIADMIELLGRPPASWWEQWDAKDKWFNEDGQRLSQLSKNKKRVRKHRPMSLRLQQSDRDGEIGEQELEVLEELFLGKVTEDGKVASHGMLEYEPSKRLTASEVIASDWMARWALPALRKGVWNEEPDIKTQEEWKRLDEARAVKDKEAVEAQWQEELARDSSVIEEPEEWNGMRFYGCGDKTPSDDHF